ncbi:MAG: ATP-dependent helicase, partial [Desulfurococcaceae archaeon]|nr:ATP-dependent helicase [Desulfurococcaceae archaeon]
QANAEVMMKVVESIPRFPILEEAYREVMEDVMDVENAEEVLRSVERGDISIRVVRVDGPPSPFAHGIVAHGYSDVILMEDRRRLLLKLYEEVMRKLAKREQVGGYGSPPSSTFP